jgi:hypothetical protein
MGNLEKKDAFISETEQLADLAQEIETNLRRSIIFEKRGKKAAAKRARKQSIELGKRMPAWRKASVKVIG